MLEGDSMLSKVLKYLNALYRSYQGVTIPDIGVSVHRSVSFNPGVAGGNRGQIIIQRSATLKKGVVVNCYGGKVNIGHNSFLGEYVIIYGHGGVEIGSNTLIAMHTCILSSNHTIPSRSELIRYTPDVLLPVKIGSDVWIGAGCKILGGITIGDGCVVGAGSVVTKDLPDYSISVGNPAKIIKMRKIKDE
jgi:acetyltransferase-like isoleucine patch superfamily enzyme